jgi:hypothetical protein
MVNDPGIIHVAPPASTSSTPTRSEMLLEGKPEGKAAKSVERDAGQPAWSRPTWPFYPWSMRALFCGSGLWPPKNQPTVLLHLKISSTASQVARGSRSLITDLAPQPQINANTPVAFQLTSLPRRRRT